MTCTIGYVVMRGLSAAVNPESNPKFEDDCSFLAQAGRELVEHCGLTDNVSVVKLIPQNVPIELHPLIPCAEQWNIGDDYYRGHILYSASPEVLRALVRILQEYGPVIRNWLEADFEKIRQTGDESTNEMGAFLWLETSAVEAFGILRSRFGEEHEL